MKFNNFAKLHHALHFAQLPDALWLFNKWLPHLYLHISPIQIHIKVNLFIFILNFFVKHFYWNKRHKISWETSASKIASSIWFTRLSLAQFTVVRPKLTTVRNVFNPLYVKFLFMSFRIYPKIDIDNESNLVQLKLLIFH